MSALTRTKGYFVIVCVLMCGFLITFSWHLLSNVTYTTANIKDLKDNKDIKAAERESQEFVVRNSTSLKQGLLGRLESGGKKEENVKELGGKLHEGFTELEVSGLIAKIRELGLSTKEVSEKLVAWKKQGNIHMNTLTVPQTHKTKLKDLKKLKDVQNTKDVILHLNFDQILNKNMKKLNETMQNFGSSKQIIRDNDVQNDGDRLHPSSQAMTKEKNHHLHSPSHSKLSNFLKSVKYVGNNNKQTKNASGARLGGDFEENKTVFETTLRPDYCSTCFEFNFSIILNQEKLCKSSSGKSEAVQLLILIASAPANYHQRTVIRETWGARCKEPGVELRCVFVVGLSTSEDTNSKIQLENDHHSDMLQIGFKDSYANLTYKTISSLKWALKHCYSATYVMKTDDDMYINTELIPIMLRAAPVRKFMGGACWGSSSPNRDMSSKWFVSIQSFHKPRFPPMCSGTGYIMSIDVVRSVIFSSQNIPFFHLEDVYVSLCLQRYGILPINILGFSNAFQDRDACQYKNAVMTSHQVPSRLLEQFWLSMSRCPKSDVAPDQLFIAMPYPET